MHNIILVLLILTVACLRHSQELEDEMDLAIIDSEYGERRTYVTPLSRKKRYLTFPTGSSLQLVYCLTMPTTRQGNLFTMGGTAAVAWQLPTDTYITMRKKFRDQIKERTEKIIKMMQAAQAAANKPATGMRRNDYGTNQYYKQSQGSAASAKISYPVSSYYNNQSSYYNSKNPARIYPLLQTPAPTYQNWNNKWKNKYPTAPIKSQYNWNRSYNNQNVYSDEDSYPINKQTPHRDDYLPNNQQYSYSKDYSTSRQHSDANNGYDTRRRKADTDFDYDEEYEHQFNKEMHRRTRRELYSKIEKFFVALNKDGKSCLLKAICEVSQTSENELGSFVQEILKAIFTVKSHEHLPEENDEYDSAANKQHNCTDRYPKCPSSVWNIF